MVPGPVITAHVLWCSSSGEPSYLAQKFMWWGPLAFIEILYREATGFEGQPESHAAAFSLVV
ncbi:hypothetical protein I79_006059 [Cricetulus griseus]|uniref:Uncharacterized protein n=1 Tax=Cricetulus griseus TaxID=10029 RepID=G3H6U0_CRIGR|nr:hypothetical protein I79_006059 [Cricetulus griseus]